MSDTLPSRRSLLIRGMDGVASEIVVAGTRFSMNSDTYLINGIAVGEVAWQERLRGARELHRVISEICSAQRTSGHLAK